MSTVSGDANAQDSEKIRPGTALGVNTSDADGVSGKVDEEKPSLQQHISVPQPPSEKPQGQVSISQPPSTDPEAVPSSDSGDGPEPEETYPEGGREAWLVVLGSWFGLFSSLGIMNTISTLQAYVITHQLADYPPGQVGWIFSVYVFLSFFGGIAVGPIFDKHGPRLLLLFGTIGLVGAIVLLSVSTAYWHFMLGFGVFGGLSTCCLFSPSVAAIGHFFKARRGLATGIATTGGSVASIIFPPFLTALFDRIGYGWTIRALALICLVSTLSANFLVRSRLPPAKNATVRPDVLILKRVPVFLTAFGMFLVELAMFMPIAYTSSYMLANGFTKSFSYNTTSILNAGSLIGRALPGYLADIFGPFNINTVAVVIGVVTSFAIWLPAGATMPGIVIFALLIGFSSGANVSIFPICVGRLCKTQEYGRYYATTYTIISFAPLISIPIGGEILQSNGGNYWGLIVFTGMVYVVAMIFTWGARVSLGGWDPRKKI